MSRAACKAVLLAMLTSPPVGQAIADTESPRHRTRINAGWRFHTGHVDDAPKPSFDDGGWLRVDLPHTWNAQDGQDGGDDYYRGVGWYRRTFELIRSQKQNRVFVRCGAANTVADVYCNGAHVGQHRGGYAAFCLELTSFERWDGPNVLAVKVDNSHFDDVPPYSADYTFFGGIYRDVELLYTSQVCISPADHASSGVYLLPVDIDPERAVVQARVVLSNATNVDLLQNVRIAVHDADGRAVPHFRKAVAVPRNEEQLDTLQELAIPRPRVWHGRHDPYLYRVRVELETLGRVIDRVDQPLGLRSFRVDPKSGFVLNGRAYDLFGVNRHQDRKDHGWALNRGHHDSDMATIADLGCTMVRLAHYQHDDSVYAWCDRAGLVVWAEILLINRITKDPELATNCRQQLTEPTRQNYNHPSICFWGIHNEITAPWLDERGPDPSALVKLVHDHAKEEDPSRLTVCAATDPVDHPANWHTDLTAFNRYYGWYGGQAADIGPWLDALHAKRDVAIGISEYGAGASVRQHAWPPHMPRHDGPVHPEEYQSLFHEQHWARPPTRPFVWCKLVWSMFDFASDSRSEGDAAGVNDKGLVTFDHTTAKDAAYWYRSQWSTRPVVHIAGRRFNPRPARAPVRVFSNCADVELLINGTPLSGQSNHGVFEFQIDDQPHGQEVVVQAIGHCGTQRLVDSCSWRIEDAGGGR